MSQVASRELCKELYELSGWDGTDEQYHVGMAEYCPAYDLGYLLRKLPAKIPFSDGEITLRVEIWWAGGWYAHYGIYDWKAAIADTPEDAACKLAIELFNRRH